MRRFVEISGLDLVMLEATGGSLHIFADTMAKHLQPIPLGGKALAMLLQHILGAVTRTPLGRTLSRKTSHVYPLGYFLIAQKPVTR